MHLKLLLGFLILGFSAMAQKEAKPEFDKSNQTLTQSDQFLLRIDKVGKLTSPTFHVDVYDKNNERVMRVDMRSYKDFQEITAANKDGKVHYAILTFPELDLITEIKGYLGVNGKTLAKNLYELNFIIDGLLDKESVEEFVKVNGTSPYSSGK